MSGEKRVEARCQRMAYLIEAGPPADHAGKRAEDDGGFRPFGSSFGASVTVSGVRRP